MHMAFVFVKKFSIYCVNLLGEKFVAIVPLINNERKNMLTVIGGLYSIQNRETPGEKQISHMHIMILTGLVSFSFS